MALRTNTIDTACTVYLIVTNVEVKWASHKIPFLNHRGFATGYFYCYRPQTKLREDNVFTPVCDSVHRGGGLCVSGPGRGGSVREAPLYGNERAVRILLECILAFF